MRYFNQNVLLFDFTLKTPSLSKRFLYTSFDVIFTGKFISSDFENIQKLKNKKPLKDEFALSKYPLSFSEKTIVIYVGDSDNQYEVRAIDFNYEIKNSSSLNYGDEGYQLVNEKYEILDFGDFFIFEYLIYNSKYLLNKEYFGDGYDQIW
jgi:hypothetical protein